MSKNYVISIDGPAGVGKTNFATDLADAISYQLAARACESFAIRYFSPKGTRLSWDPDPVGAPDRSALRRVIKSFIDGSRIDCPETRANEIVSSLIYTQNVCSYLDALRAKTFQDVDKIICIIDGGFLSCQMRRNRDCSDFIKKLDANVVLLNKPETLVEQAKKKAKQFDEFDKDFDSVSDLIGRYKQYVGLLDEQLRAKTFVLNFEDDDKVSAISETPSKRWARRFAGLILKDKTFVQ